jgi:hypothetical protein
MIGVVNPLSFIVLSFPAPIFSQKERRSAVSEWVNQFEFFIHHLFNGIENHLRINVSSFHLFSHIVHLIGEIVWGIPLECFEMTQKTVRSEYEELCDSHQMANNFEV